VNAPTLSGQTNFFLLYHKTSAICFIIVKIKKSKLK
jgi:hypothetical protein